MSNYTEMSEWDRRELLSNVGTLAHLSDEYLKELIELNKRYQELSNVKIGLGEIIKN